MLLSVWECVGVWVCACVPVYVCVITLSSFSDRYETRDLINDKQQPTFCCALLLSHAIRHIYHFPELANLTRTLTFLRQKVYDREKTPRSPSSGIFEAANHNKQQTTRSDTSTTGTTSDSYIFACTNPTATNDISNSSSFYALSTCIRRVKNFSS